MGKPKELYSYSSSEDNFKPRLLCCVGFIAMLMWYMCMFSKISHQTISPLTLVFVGDFLLTQGGWVGAWWLRNFDPKDKMGGVGGGGGASTAYKS